MVYYQKQSGIGVSNSGMAKLTQNQTILLHIIKKSFEKERYERYFSISKEDFLSDMSDISRKNLRVIYYIKDRSMRKQI